MPDTKISDLTTGTTPDGSELLPGVQGGATRKWTLTTIFAAAIASGGALAALDTVGAGEIDDEAIGINHLADGTDGTLISWDTAGEAVVIAVGTAGQILTSQGAGAVPTWETASGGYTNEEAQDAVGAMVNGSLTYTDAMPLMSISDSDKGDITTSSAGTSWQIDAAAVGYPELANGGALSVMGRSANSSGVRADISCTAGASGVLRESGSTLGCGTIGSAAITDNSLTITDIADSAAHGDTWTPTLTGVANVTSSTAFQCQYLLVSKIVTASCKLEVTATAGETLTELGISLPAGATSNFGADEDCAGVAVATNELGAYVVADTANDRCELDFTFATSGSYTFRLSFTYEII